MSGVVIRVDVSDFEREMRKLIGHLRNKEPMYRSWGEILLNSTKQRFHDEKDPDGNRWAPLAPATVARRLKKHGNAQITILRESGSTGLFGTLKDEVTARGVRVGANKDYAAIHNEGGRAGRNKSVTIPARTYLGLSSADRRDLMEEAMWHLKGRK